MSKLLLHRPGSISSPPRPSLEITRTVQSQSSQQDPLHQVAEPDAIQYFRRIHVKVFTVPFQLDPWLNGDYRTYDLRFDLSDSSFVPRKHIDSVRTFGFLRDELTQPATRPGITRLRIVCDLIPQWPMDLAPIEIYVNTSPLSIEDVLVTIHRHMHTPIYHPDWASLVPAEQQEIRRAFRRRCTSYRSTEEQVVKRVDYLRGKTWFRGLVPTAESHTMKLVLD